jgi:glycerol-3-phosphate O-acyltransferase / dihydroxyacetone phosphate acyltransferase
MALGAMLKYPDLKITIIGCGLKYFKPHQFRSKAIIEYSTPYEIPKEMVELYKTDKKEACGQLLKQIEKKMKEVTLHAENYEELKSIFIAR